MPWHLSARSIQFFQQKCISLVLSAIMVEIWPWICLAGADFPNMSLANPEHSLPVSLFAMYGILASTF
jgi:hypothetical protein